MALTESKPDWYWPGSTKLNTPSTPFSGVETADIAVIGAGYTGLSCALHCAQSGLNIIVLESQVPGYGASGRNAGQWLPGWVGKTPEDILRIFGKTQGQNINRFAAEAVALFQDSVRGHEVEVDFRKCGILQLTPCKKQLRKLYILADQWSAYGVEIEKHDKRSLGEYINTDRYCGGIRFCQAGTINPFAYSNLLARAAEKAGVRLRCYTPVTGLSHSEYGWKVNTATGVVEVASVVLATNAYSTDMLWPGLGKAFYRFSLPMLASTTLADAGRSFLPQRTPFAELTPAGLFGGMLTPDNRWLASTFPLRNNTADIEAIGHWSMQRFRHTFPSTPEFNWEQLWWGDIALSPDSLPRMIKLADNLYTAFGYSGGGILLATALGRELANTILGGDNYVSSYPLSRFKTLPATRLLPVLARQLLIPGLRRLEKIFG